jgi:hypothetical protein
LLRVTEDQTAVDPEGAMLHLVCKFSTRALAVSAIAFMAVPLVSSAFAQEAQEPKAQASQESASQESKAKASMYGQQCVEQVDRVAPQSGTGAGDQASREGQRTPLYRSCLDNGGRIPGSLGYFGRAY